MGNMLTARIVPSAAAPRYPTRLEAKAQPRLLRQLPAAWLTRRELASAAALMLSWQVSGCGEQSSQTQTDERVRLASDAAAVVAPLFVHGEGRGSFGCIAVNPPAVLSEEEALAIIAEELTVGGLRMTETNVTIPGVSLPCRLEIPAQDWVTGVLEFPLTELRGKTVPLVAQLRDAERQVAVALVCRSNVGRLGTSRGMSTAVSYDLKELAKYANEHANKTGRGSYLGVLYDPLAGQEDLKTVLERLQSSEGATRPEPSLVRRERRSNAEAESRRLLRLQVKDFLDWLKAQGVI